MKSIKRILLTGGGTAGHVNPALAIGSALAAPETSFLYVGVHGRVEEEVVPREGIPIKYVRASGYPGGLSPEIGPFLLNLLAGTIQSIFILLGFRPDVIVGSGGYVSAPVIMAASLLRKLHISHARIFIHEQNAAPGKMNQLMGRFADQVFVTFPETLPCFPKNGVLAGYPLRKRLTLAGYEEARQKIGMTIPEGRKIVLVFGGSQGARTINRAMVDALGCLLLYRNSLFIIHGVGLLKSGAYNAMADTEARLHQLYNEEQLRQIKEFYAYQDYFHDIERLYAVCNLVVARGGAGSLNEIAAMGLPALIIPKSNLPGDHQVMNARSMERAGGVEILYEEIAPVNGKLSGRVDGKILAEKLISLLQDDLRLQEMSCRNRAFFHQDALSRIERRIRGLEMEEAGNPFPPAETSTDIDLPGNRVLLSLLERACKKHGDSYRPECVVPRAQDLEYLKTRAAALLIHTSWQERNLGVKLLGLLGAREKTPALLALYNDRTPASRLKKIFGGDFEQVGFIRRNMITTLVRLNEVSSEVEQALLMGIRDPYYEVRAETARAIAFFGSRLSSSQQFISSLLELLLDPNIDVAAAAAEALGKLGGENDALPALLSMWDVKLWRIRASVLRGILYLVKRGVVANLDIISDQASRFILTSTDFTPQFEIKAVYRDLMESVFREKGKRAVQ